jgi:lactoylglutathione lyase
MAIDDMTNFSFDHYALEVYDLEKSLFFYCNILGFKILPRPDFDFEGAWLDIQNGQAIHLIRSNEQLNVRSASRKLHFAFRHNDLLKLQEYLKSFQIEMLPIKTRPDGVKQLFVKDPDGYFIEFCDK